MNKKDISLQTPQTVREFLENSPKVNQIPLLVLNLLMKLNS